MISLRDQEAIGRKFATELFGPVKIDYFTERNLGITLPGKTPCQYCKPAREMLQEISGLSDLISLRIHYFEDNTPEKAQFGVERVPGIVLRGQAGNFVTFYGIPGGTEFPMFIESIVDLSRGEVLLSEESVKALAELEQDVSIKVFVTPTCPYCPAMMRAAYQMAMISPKVHAETIEVNEFPELADRYQVQAVPLTVINDTVAIPGMVHEKLLVEQVMKVAKGEAAEGKPAPSKKKIERGKTRDSGLYIP
jgi:glutaredoxin-like protein